MNLKEKVDLLFSGKKVTNDIWDSSEYIYYDEKLSKFITEEGDEYFPDNSDDWVEWKEPKQMVKKYIWVVKFKHKCCYSNTQYYYETEEDVINGVCPSYEVIKRVDSLFIEVEE